MLQFIDTHAHIDGKEFDEDRAETINRAKQAGVTRIFIPAIDLPSLDSTMKVCKDYPGYAYPMIGLHPEEVRADWKDVLGKMKEYLSPGHPFIAIGEVGLDYYWSREFEHEQLSAFEKQVEWSIEQKLPLMIHCRKGQNEMVAMLRHYKNDLPGGVFHCFTGNAHEAEELLDFDNFALGIGGVLTFKKSHLPETLAEAVPLGRIVLETDSPYMAPVPRRGERNESSFVKYVLAKLAECYGVSEQEVADATNANVKQIFGITA